MINLLPASLPKAAPLPDFYPAQGPRRARVALLAGCVQQVLAPEINWATLRVLARNGVEVLIPQAQGCCGALSIHIGEAGQARGLARANLAGFPEDVDAVITNAAGCGSGMKEYPLLFKGMEEEAQAASFAQRAMDISVFLQRIGLAEPPPLCPAARRRLPRRLPPGQRARRAQPAAPAARQHPQPHGGRDPRGRAVLRLGRHVQSATA